MISFYLLRNLLASDERRSEENEGVGRAWDVRGVSFPAVARAVGAMERYLGPSELSELGRRCRNGDGALPDCFERDGGIRAQGCDRRHVGEESKRH